MSNVYLVEIPQHDTLTADERRCLKMALGQTVRAVLGAETPVTIDHLGVPVNVQQQED